MIDTVEIMAEEFKMGYPLTYDAIYNKGRADAIDEFCNVLCSNGTIADFMKDYIIEKGKELKEQNK